MMSLGLGSGLRGLGHARPNPGHDCVSLIVQILVLGQQILVDHSLVAPDPGHL